MVGCSCEIKRCLLLGRKTNKPRQHIKKQRCYFANKSLSSQYSSVQLLSRVWLFATPWIAARQASLSINNSQSSLKLVSIESVMPSSHLILCHPHLLLPTNLPSIRIFSSESALCIRWPKNWSFHFSISPSKVDFLFRSLFRTDWLDLLAVRDSQESSPAPRFERINPLVLSLLYGPTLTSIHDYWKTRALNIWAFGSKVMSLIFNMLSRSVIAFLPRSKRLLIYGCSPHLQWFWSPKK